MGSPNRPAPQRLALVDVLLRSLSRGPPSAVAGGMRPNVGDSPFCRPGSTLKSSPDLVRVKRQLRILNGVPQQPLSCLFFLLSGSCFLFLLQGSQELLLNQKYQRPRTDLGTGFNAPHSPPNSPPAI